MKRMLPHILCWCFLLVSSLGYAQNRTISGKVLDEKGAPVSFASILVKGSKLGTSSNEEGVFSIAVTSSKSVLQFKAVGFEDKELEVVLEDLGLEKNTPGVADKNFKLTITKIGLVTKAAMDEAFFKAAFPSKEVNSEAELKTAVKDNS